MRTIAVGVLLVGVAGCAGTSDDLATLRPNMEKLACNATNGAYRSRIVDVALYAASGQTPALVYVVELDDRRYQRSARKHGCPN